MGFLPQSVGEAQVDEVIGKGRIAVAGVASRGFGFTIGDALRAVAVKSQAWAWLITSVLFDRRSGSSWVPSASLTKFLPN
jgi:hypothetical protein